jgi:hypothetical protein
MNDQPHTFDHTAHEGLSEYQDLRRAVDALVALSETTSEIRAIGDVR